MEKLRIAFFLDVLKEDFDGVSITMHQIISRIPKDKISPVFITPQLPENDLGFPVYECPSYDIPLSSKDYKFATPRRMKELPKLLADFDPHLLHFSSPSALGSYAIKYGKAHNLPVTTIYHTHFPSFAEYYFRYIKGIEKVTEPIMYRLFWLYREVTRVFAPTLSMKKYLLGKDVKEERIKIWGRGVSTERFGPHHRDEDFWPELPKESKKVLFVSRLVKEKEPWTLIRLYKMFEEHRPDIRMVIVGDGPKRKLLEKNMPNAHFSGKLVGEDLSKAYASSDIFVFPSTTETFGNVVLEALASGLPVVAANAGGPKDIVQHGETGMLVTPRKEEEFYGEIVKLVDDKGYYQQVRKNALDYATSQNWENLCKDLFAEYEYIISNHKYSAS